MAYDNDDITSPEVRTLFTRESVLKSEWYKKRLIKKQSIEINLIEQKIKNMEAFIANPINKSIVNSDGLAYKLETAKITLKYLVSKDYLNSLVGTLGADDVK